MQFYLSFQRLLLEIYTSDTCDLSLDLTCLSPYVIMAVKSASNEHVDVQLQ